MSNSLQPTEEPKSLIEEIKQAAEEATQNTGFLYDETSGLYYDSHTGYYYNAEYGLYYDPKTGTYMSYKPETNSYLFHSQVTPVPLPHLRKKSNINRNKTKIKSVQSDESPEEGECTTSDSSPSLSVVSSDSDDSDNEFVKKWPPCMRLIVEQSTNEKIKVGSLYILTYEGGTVGREGDTHSIVLPDLNISKFHLKFSFNEDENDFYVIDMGSRNGTILNGVRISPAKRESASFKVAHGSRIKIGSITLLCHVHEGNRTCGHCEPGLIQQQLPNKKIETLSKEDSFKYQLKKLKKKFGVNDYQIVKTKLAAGYVDRAEERRINVGSQNPHEKTEVASIEQPIGATNKGFKMLSKMGWKEGECLGKNENQGLIEPIPLISNPGTSGIGCDNPLGASFKFDSNKIVILKKTQDRFKKLNESTCGVFDDSD